MPWHLRQCAPPSRGLRLAAVAACVAAWAVMAGSPAPAELIWWDGSADTADGPPGLLLSENGGYWGEQVLTGVSYEYEAPPDNPADRYRDTEEFGRRLLDGRVRGNWWVPVGVSNRPLVVTFDFQRPCRFTEVDLICSRSPRVGLKLETRAAPDEPWAIIHEAPLESQPENPFQRIPLSEPAQGRYVRLTAEAPGILYVDEVLVWGDAEVSAEYPEAIRPLAEPENHGGVAYSSIPGVAGTVLSDAQYWDWARRLEAAGRRLPVVWSRVPTWDTITDRPLLPEPAEVVSSVQVEMARNETECVALALTSTDDQPLPVTPALSAFQTGTGSVALGIAGTLRIAGAAPSRHFGVGLSPLFEAGNLLDDGLMQRYLTNGAQIADFPRLTLGPVGSAVLWLSVTTDDAAPGRYRARLSCGAGSPVMVEVRVHDVTLPDPPVWLNTWSRTTTQFPLEYADRPEREVAYKQSLGVTVWNGFPEPGSLSALARERGRALFHVYGIPSKYVHDLYASRIDPAAISAEDRAAITEHVRGLVQRAGELGMGYEDWYVELTDEPGPRNSAGFGAIAALIKQADPRVRVYCNPCFWVGDGVVGDSEVFAALSPWYSQVVDVSVPLYLLLRDRPRCYELFTAPRAINAQYDVATQSARGEAAAHVERYRRMAWDAFGHGFNGWGFYSYYAPRGDPWDDRDVDWSTREDRADYQMVFPGPRGPIATRPAEAVREGWEDYRLLTLLRERGAEAQVAALLAARAAGEPLAELRLQALRLAAGPDR